PVNPVKSATPAATSILAGYGNRYHDAIQTVGLFQKTPSHDTAAAGNAPRRNNCKRWHPVPNRHWHPRCKPRPNAAPVHGKALDRSSDEKTDYPADIGRGY